MKIKINKKDLMNGLFILSLIPSIYASGSTVPIIGNSFIYNPLRSYLKEIYKKGHLIPDFEKIEYGIVIGKEEIIPELISNSSIGEDSVILYPLLPQEEKFSNLYLVERIVFRPSQLSRDPSDIEQFCKVVDNYNGIINYSTIDDYVKKNFKLNKK